MYRAVNIKRKMCTNGVGGGERKAGWGGLCVSRNSDENSASSREVEHQLRAECPRWHRDIPTMHRHHRHCLCKAHIRTVLLLLLKKERGRPTASIQPLTSEASNMRLIQVRLSPINRFGRQSTPKQNGCL